MSGRAVERENAARGVFLTSSIDYPTYEKLAPQIVKLRLAGAEPICLFIHSGGGIPFFAEKIMRLMRAPLPSGEKCMVTTVCIGWAASAAADMLSAGDYAIAYADSTVLVHGTREQHEELTVEMLGEVEENLDHQNNYFAMKLANKMFRRFATQALLLEAYKTTPPASTVMSVAADPIQIFATIRKKVDPEHAPLIDSAMERMLRVKQLLDYCKSIGEGDDTSDQITKDARLLKQLVDFEFEALKKSKSVGFTTEGIELIHEDFESLKEFLSGQFYSQAVELSKQRGQYFLNAEEMLEYHKKNDEEKMAYLQETAAPRIFPLWYLVVALCRSMQVGEHSFSAHDAWWFGLVDEVPGSQLPSTRLWKEQRKLLKEGAASNPA